MGKNRHHDKQASEISQRHDAIKEKNRLEREAKEKARLEKYEKPFQVKSDSHELQMALHKLVFDTPKNNQKTKDWIVKYRKVMVESKKLGIWDGFQQKYRLSSRGYEI
jgi:hypothetical protein